jgi:hypothetical protein
MAQMTIRKGCEDRAKRDLDKAIEYYAGIDER